MNNTTNKETWKDIEGYENLYQVSNLGHIKSLPRQVWNGSSLYETKTKILKPLYDKDGYQGIHLYKNKKGRRFKIHRLVCSAFVPNPDNKPQVNHIDGNKTNNTVYNLEWCTSYENSKHSKANGLNDFKPPVHYGIKNPSSKLTEKEVIEIRRLYATGSYKQSELAAMFGISQNGISCIISRKTWKHVK